MDRASPSAGMEPRIEASVTTSPAHVERSTWRRGRSPESSPGSSVALSAAGRATESCERRRRDACRLTLAFSFRSHQSGRGQRATSALWSGRCRARHVAQERLTPIAALEISSCRSSDQGAPWTRVDRDNRALPLRGVHIDQGHVSKPRSVRSRSSPKQHLRRLDEMPARPALCEAPFGSGAAAVPSRKGVALRLRCRLSFRWLRRVGAIRACRRRARSRGSPGR